MLVATTVIEVGVDVPNASLMVIEHAERFGLSQLHQLRGRVGRGARRASACCCTRSRCRDTAQGAPEGDATRPPTASRSRGATCEIRGPGEFLGARQSGAPLLRFADLERDVELVERARDAADELLRREPAAAHAHLERWLGGKAGVFQGMNGGMSDGLRATLAGSAELLRGGDRRSEAIGRCRASGAPRGRRCPVPRSDRRVARRPPH